VIVYFRWRNIQNKCKTLEIFKVGWQRIDIKTIILFNTLPMTTRYNFNVHVLLWMLLMFICSLYLYCSCTYSQAFKFHKCILKLSSSINTFSSIQIPYITDVYFPWNTLPLIVTFYDTWPSDLDQLIVYLFLFYTIVIFR
jgi:hypothetical protein